MRGIKKIMSIVLGCVFISALGSVVGGADKPAAPNALSDAEKAAGWRLLFDGKSADAWRAYRGNALPPEWRVAAGELQLHDKGGKLATGIVTREEFADFELSLEWRISRGGNSGILYRVNEEHAPPHDSGPEMQILDDDRYPPAKNPPERRAAACYDVYAPSAKVSVVPGQWNRVRIVARGNHVEHWFNGVKVVEYELGSPDWRARVARSKFAKSAFYGKEARGHILLQQHGYDVAFRDIKIRVLD